MAGAAIIDWDGLVVQFKGQEGVVVRIAGTVLRTQADMPRQLRELIGKRDYEALARLAHSLKGMGGNLMAGQVFELGKQADLAAREKSEEALHLAERLAQAMEALLEELERRLRAVAGEGDGR